MMNLSGTSPGGGLGSRGSGSTSGASRWLPRILPVERALEDVADDLATLDLTTEEGIEVTEGMSDLDAAAEDRNMPRAFEGRRYDEPPGEPKVVGAGGAAIAALGAPGVALSAQDGDVQTQQQSWRMRERMKTVSVALVVCLNVGVDPPDVTKTQPCARMECWIDPTTVNPQRAIENIGAALQKQYERWQPRARYRQSLDPPLEEVS